MCVKDGVCVCDKLCVREMCVKVLCESCVCVRDK